MSLNIPEGFEEALEQLEFHIDYLAAGIEEEAAGEYETLDEDLLEEDRQLVKAGRLVLKTIHNWRRTET